MGKIPQIPPPVISQGAIFGLGGALRPKPKTLVIMGSSNGAGVGSSTYVTDPSAANGWASPTNSWAGLLKTALQSIDGEWTVINRSISGSNTTDAMNRFFTDVAPHRPSHVILCVHPVNDSVNAKTYYTNTLTLIRYCHMIGAIPILRGAYMYNSYTASQYASMLQLNKMLDALGYWRIDNFSLLDNGSGGYIGGTTYQIGDGLHPNDAGYAAFFSAIDLGMFIRQAQGPVNNWDKGAWRLASGVSGTGIKIYSGVGLESNIKSFTMRARIKGNASLASARTFMGAYVFGTYPTNLPLRVRNAFGPYEIADTIGALGSASSIDPTTDPNTVHDVAFTYNHLTNSVAVYIDGATFGGGGTPSGTPTFPVSEFVFGSQGPSGTSSTAALATFADMAIWQTPLSAAAIADMARNNRPPKGSCIFLADTSYAPPTTATYGFIQNKMANRIAPDFGEALWEQVAPI